jgi:hypothetical protein
VYLPQGGYDIFSFNQVVNEIVKENKKGTPEFKTRDMLKVGGVCNATDFKGKCTKQLSAAFDAAAKVYASGEHEKYKDLFPKADPGGGLQLSPNIPKWVPFALIGGIVLLFLAIR